MQDCVLRWWLANSASTRMWRRRRKRLPRSMAILRVGIYQTLLGALKLYFCNTKIFFWMSNIMSLMNACACSSYSALGGSCFANIHQDSKWVKYNVQMPWGIRGTLSPGTDRDRQPTGGLLWKSRRPRDKSETGVTGQWAPQRPLGSSKVHGSFGGLRGPRG